MGVLCVSACKYDKAAHITGGVAVSEFVSQRTGSRTKGCLASMGLGILKEAYDATGHGVVDGGDVLATGFSCRWVVRF